MKRSVDHDQPTQEESLPVPEVGLTEVRNGHPTNAAVFLPLRPLEQMAGPMPSFEKPVELGCFSLDESRQFRQDSSRLRFFHGIEPSLNNLSHGYERFVRRDENIPEHLDHLLMFWQNLQRAQARSPPTIMTWRGLLTTVLCTPYNKQDPWTLAVTLNHGTLFIEQVEKSQTPSRSPAQAERQQLMTYWGYKFEQLTTSNTRKRPTQIQKQNEIEAPVNNNEAFCSVLRTKLNQHSIVIGAEVDCADPSNPVPSQAYIELKTSKQISNEHDQFYFERHKLLKFWAQSFLAGIPQVVVGFRDDNGFIRDVQTLETLRIPRMIRGKPNMWDPVVCLRFLDEFLTWLRSVVTVDSRNVSYIVQYGPPWDRIVLRQSNGYAFVPDWFTLVPPSPSSLQHVDTAKRRKQN